MSLRNRSGFTLIEVLASLVVVTILMGMLIQVSDQFADFARDDLLSDGTAIAPSFSADVNARRLHALFLNDLFSHPVSYVVGGSRLHPADPTITGTALAVLSSPWPSLGFNRYPRSSREFEAATSSVLTQLPSSRTFADEEFSVIMLLDMDTIGAVYHVYKTRVTEAGVDYNVYEVIGQSSTAPSDNVSYRFAIEATADNFTNPVGAIHRYHRYDPDWGIEDQDSVFVVFPDPLITGGGIDSDGNPINPVSRFVYEIAM
jgi:prepilin-type N-terminal cleavage/methylation domain-containing protein